MIEIPEGKNLENQVKQCLINKTIRKVYPALNAHKFCWYTKDVDYNLLFTGQTIKDAFGHGMYLDLYLDNATLSIGDGTNIRYLEPYEKLPEKHQLLIEFDGGGFLVFTVAMYGGIWAFEKGSFDNSYYQGSLKSISPLSKEFNENHFDNLFKSVKKDLSAKAFLATEQRIPGLGNGILQDILLVSGIHPKRKISTISDSDKSDLLYSIKAVIDDMASKGGRDTEKDLFGNFGGYETLLSKKSFSEPLQTLRRQDSQGSLYGRLNLLLSFLSKTIIRDQVR